MRKSVSILLCLLLAGCGYCFDSALCREKLSVSVPFICGDPEGRLTSELIRELTTSGAFTYSPCNGEMILQVKILSNLDERIGFRYDREPLTGDREHRLVPTEGRRHIVAQVCLWDSCYEETLLGPLIVEGRADYDYFDPNSIQDLAFTPLDAKDAESESTLAFSLGQLDSSEGAQLAATIPAFRDMAQQIIAALSSLRFSRECQP